MPGAGAAPPRAPTDPPLAAREVFTSAMVISTVSEVDASPPIACVPAQVDGVFGLDVACVAQSGTRAHVIVYFATNRTAPTTPGPLADMPLPNDLFTPPVAIAELSFFSSVSASLSVVAADVNGDGFDELFFESASAVYCYTLATRSLGTSPPTNASVGGVLVATGLTSAVGAAIDGIASRYTVADVSGDGILDVVYVTGVNSIAVKYGAVDGAGYISFGPGALLTSGTGHSGSFSVFTHPTPANATHPGIFYGLAVAPSSYELRLLLPPYTSAPDTCISISIADAPDFVLSGPTDLNGDGMPDFVAINTTPPPPVFYLLLSSPTPSPCVYTSRLLSPVVNGTTFTSEANGWFTVVDLLGPGSGPFVFSGEGGAHVFAPLDVAPGTPAAATVPWATTLEDAPFAVASICTPATLRTGGPPDGICTRTGLPDIHGLFGSPNEPYGPLQVVPNMVDLVGPDINALLAADVDNDGDSDLFHIDDSDDIFFHRNNGGGLTWSSSAIAMGGAFCVFDAEGDGFLDLAYGDTSNDLVIAHATPASFAANTSYTTTTGPFVLGFSSIIVIVPADVNGDAKADLVISGDSGVVVYLSSPLSPIHTFVTIPPPPPPFPSFGPNVGLVAADINADGFDDVVIVFPTLIFVWHGAPDGNHAAATKASSLLAPRSVVLADPGRGLGPIMLVTADAVTVTAVLLTPEALAASTRDDTLTLVTSVEVAFLSLYAVRAHSDGHLAIGLFSTRSVVVWFSVTDPRAYAAQGLFGSSTELAPLSAIGLHGAAQSLDLTADSFADLAVALTGAGGGLYGLMMQGVISTTTPAAATPLLAPGQGARFADLNADGAPDVFLPSTAISFNRPDNPGLFQFSATTPPFDTVANAPIFVDVNDDGYLDIVEVGPTVYAWTTNPSLFEDVSAGEPITATIVEAAGALDISTLGDDCAMVGLIDVNADGQPDVLVACQEEFGPGIILGFVNASGLAVPGIATASFTSLGVVAGTQSGLDVASGFLSPPRADPVVLTSSDDGLNIVHFTVPGGPGSVPVIVTTVALYAAEWAIGASELQLVDIDNDGAADIAFTLGDQPYWMQNIGRLLPSTMTTAFPTPFRTAFGAIRRFTENSETTVSFSLVDLDHDGRLEMVRRTATTTLAFVQTSAASFQRALALVAGPPVVEIVLDLVIDCGYAPTLACVVRRALAMPTYASGARHILVLPPATYRHCFKRLHQGLRYPLTLKAAVPGTAVFDCEGDGVLFAVSGPTTRVELDGIVINRATSIQAGSLSSTPALFVLDGATLVLRNVTVSNSVASALSGAVLVQDAVVEVHGAVTLVNNTGSSGGGVHLDRSKLVVHGELRLVGNTASGSGGGLLVSAASTVDLRAAPGTPFALTVEGNTAMAGGGVFAEPGSALVGAGKLAVRSNAAESAGGIIVQSCVMTWEPLADPRRWHDQVR